MAVGSHMKLAARVAILPAALAIAGAAFVHAASEIGIFSLGPGTSGRLGLDAQIAAAAVDQGLRAELARLESAQAEFPRLSDSLISSARDSFAADPLEVTSLRTIALGSVLQEDEERGRRVMQLVAQISRRDVITTMWLAQDYGRAGNTDAMMASFDHALRTSSSAQEFAMKPLVEALASEESYAPLGKLLAERPEWERAFWREFSFNPVAIANAASFLESISITADRIPQVDRRLLYTNLKRSRQFDALYRIAALDREAQASTRDLAAGQFVTSDDGNPLAWTPHSEGRFATRVLEKTGELQIDAQSGSFGVAADRIVRLGEAHRVEVDMAAPVPDNAVVSLVVRCADEAKRELVRVQISSRGRGGEATFNANGCEYASLELSFNVETGRRDALFNISSITLSPA